MKKIIFSLLLTCSLMSALATETIFSGLLTGPNEGPNNFSPGIGFGIANYNDSANTLQVLVNFSGLVGTTTASHIHAPTAFSLTGTAGVATTTPTFADFPLGITSGVYSNTLDLALVSSYNPSFLTAHGGTPESAGADLIAALFDGKAYLNIHTTAYPGGEIRGFLTQVPEPTTLVLVGLGAGGMLLRARNKRDRTRA